MDGAKLETSRPTEPDADGAAESGRTALGVDKGAPSWLKPLFFGVLVIGALYLFISLVMGWGSPLLLIGVIVGVVGLGIALNPRRASPAGGAEQP
jgi:hypothetical protein